MPAREPEPVRLFSVGHGSRHIDQLVDMLRSAGIRRLVDVRSRPGSRRHPQFGQEALRTSLEVAAIEYVWRKDLGGFRTSKPDSPHTGLSPDGFRGYADHMDTEEFDRAAEWLMAAGRDGPTAFMCAESAWENCHRRMLADALEAREAEVVHLVDGGREAHWLHPAARVDRRRVLYDLEQPQQQTLGA
jgi:uncharacterized protein (DUF488 family)